MLCVKEANFCGTTQSEKNVNNTVLLTLFVSLSPPTRIL